MTTQTQHLTLIPSQTPTHPETRALLPRPAPADLRKLKADALAAAAAAFLARGTEHEDRAAELADRCMRRWLAAAPGELGEMYRLTLGGGGL